VAGAAFLASLLIAFQIVFYRILSARHDRGFDMAFFPTVEGSMTSEDGQTFMLPAGRELTAFMSQR
jgi:hypothetical protein